MRYRFRIYKLATTSSDPLEAEQYSKIKPWTVRWHWNEYREVLTEHGVGECIGGSLSIGHRVFSLVWKSRKYRRDPAPEDR